MPTWQQELASSIRTLEELERHIPIENHEEIRRVLSAMRFSITPHTLSRIDFRNPKDPLLLMAVPHTKELTVTAEEMVDPIGDEVHQPVPFLTHRYTDRVLVYATFACAVYCRFCFRKFKTGQANPGPTKEDIERIVEYLTLHPEVDEVIVTGGDPLILPDETLRHLFSRLRSVPTITRLRIHTRVPVNLPSRITPELVELLRSCMEPGRPLYVVTHFNHPREIASENIKAISRLVDAGIVVRNQSVLLRDVNDSSEILIELFRTLVNHRVVPYYLHQLDLAKGTSHFRVPIARGRQLMREVRGRLTGIAIPEYVLDIPGGFGKVSLEESPVKTIGEGEYEIEDREGRVHGYREPPIE